MKGYHWRDGVWFDRLDGGSVTIRVEASADKYFDVGTIPAMEWESIVRAMAPASGEPSGAARSDWVATLVERVGEWQDEMAAGFEHDPFALLMAAGLLAELAKDPTFTASAEQMRATENAARVPEAMASGAEAVVREALDSDFCLGCPIHCNQCDRPTAPGAPEEGAGE